MKTPVLIKTKTLDARLSRMFLSWERNTCINLAYAILNFFDGVDADDITRMDAMLKLINLRLPNAEAVDTSDPSLGTGLSLKLPDERGTLRIYICREVETYTVVLLDLSEIRTSVSYWL